MGLFSYNADPKYSVDEINDRQLLIATITAFSVSPYYLKPYLLKLGKRIFLDMLILIMCIV
jgi:hypothetical protein